MRGLVNGLKTVITNPVPPNGNRAIMEELVYRIADLFSSTPDLGSVPEQALPWSSVFSGVGAVILGKFTGSLGSLTLPLNYSALFIGAIMSNWLLKGLDLPIDRAVQQPMLVTMIGMLVGAVAMIFWLQNENARA